MHPEYQELVMDKTYQPKKRVFISVVSHGHGALIKSLGCLKDLSANFNIVVKINKKEDGFIGYLSNNNIYYVDDYYGLGFGANNNVNYNFCRSALGMNDEDVFIIFNPDVVAKPDDINNLLKYFSYEDCKLATVNLFKDKNFTLPDNSIRNTPGIYDFFSSFVGLKNRQKIDKSVINRQTDVDWCAGSFMAFTASHYAILKGFDEKYFMYCEDVDICYRSNQLGVRVLYIPEIKILHLASHHNRNVLSKHFYWHVKSIFRFLIKKRFDLIMYSRVL